MKNMDEDLRNNDSKIMGSLSVVVFSVFNSSLHNGLYNERWLHWRKVGKSVKTSKANGTSTASCPRDNKETTINRGRQQ